VIVKIQNHDNPAALWKYISQTSPAKTGSKPVFLCGTQSADPSDGKALVAEFKGWAESRPEIKYKFRQFLWRGHQTDRLSIEQHIDLVKRCVEGEMGYALYTAWLHVGKHGNVDGHCLVAVPDLDGKVPSTKNERWRLRKVTQAFETEHGLIQTQSHSTEQHYSKDELEKAERLSREDPTMSPVPPKMAIAAALRATVEDVGGLDSLASSLATQGIGMGFRTDDHGVRQGVWFEKDGLRFSGSSVGFSLKGLQSLYENNDQTTPELGGHSPSPNDHRANCGRPTEARGFSADRGAERDERSLEAVPATATQRPGTNQFSIGEFATIFARLMLMTAIAACLLLILLCAMADGGGGHGRGLSINLPTL